MSTAVRLHRAWRSQTGHTGAIAMTRASDKRQELEDVRQFLTLLRERLPTHDEPVPSERPDIRLNLHGGRTVGIEHTTLVHQDIAAHGAHTREFTDELRSQLETARLPVYAHLSFRGSSVPWASRAIRHDQVQRAVQWIQTQVKVGTLPRSATRSELEAIGVEGLERLRAHLHGDSLASFGRVVVGARGVARVRRAFRDKEPKLKEYRSTLGADEYWLLLVAGRKFADPGWDEIEGRTFDSSFDRAFYLYAGRGSHGPTAHEIPLE